MCGVRPHLVTASPVHLMHRVVADFTYVATWSGMVYVAFVFDVFSPSVAEGTPVAGATVKKAP